MRKSSLLALVGILAIAATLIVGPGASASTERAQAGTVTIIHDQEPPNLNVSFVPNNLYATALVTNQIWNGCQIRNERADLVPRLCVAKPRIINRKPLTVRFRYKDSARWSDGKPVTAKDFRATWRVFVNPANNVISRVGYEDIAAVRGNGKVTTVVFKKTYAAWESLVSSSVYAAHIIAGKNMNEQFQTSIPISSGPWIFQSWQKGVQMTLRKNTRFKAAATMRLDRVVFRYILDTNARFQALKAGEGQVMEPQPQLQIADFLKDTNFRVDRKTQYAWEHIDFQFGTAGHPALKQRYVRQAIITGINRTQIAQALYAGIAPGLKPVQSHLFKPFESNYRPNFQRYVFSQANVINILKRNGCTGGPNAPSANNTAIWSCPNVGRLEFTFTTTPGNALRALTFEIIQRQLKSVGIQLNPRFSVTALTTELTGSQYEMIMFTFVGSPDSPITAFNIWGCDGAQNYMKYCNRALTTVLKRVSTTLDPAARARMLNAAELRYMAADIPSIPLYARPVWVIANKKVRGPVVNPTQTGHTFNVNIWTTA